MQRGRLAKTFRRAVGSLPAGTFTAAICHNPDRDAPYATEISAQDGWRHIPSLYTKVREHIVGERVSGTALRRDCDYLSLYRLRSSLSSQPTVEDVDSAIRQ